jgi:hypothetical protein
MNAAARSAVAGTGSPVVVTRSAAVHADPSVTVVASPVERATTAVAGDWFALFG